MPVKKSTSTFDGMKEQEVKDSLGYLFPGADPNPQLGILGRVAGYRTVKGDYGEFTVCDLDGAVAVEPGTMHEDGAERLLRVGACGVTVSRWIQGTLTPARFPVGAFVGVQYVGMQGRAKELKVFAVTKAAAVAAWKSATATEPGTYGIPDAPRAQPEGAAEQNGRDDDDLPF